jgi:hypothetical protein
VCRFCTLVEQAAACAGVAAPQPVNNKATDVAATTAVRTNVRASTPLFDPVTITPQLAINIQVHDDYVSGDA